MKPFHIHIKATGKGARENTYITHASGVRAAIGRAIEKFEDEFKGYRYDEMLIKVVK